MSGYYKLVYEYYPPESGNTHNKLPEGLREISPSEFWHWFGTYSPKKIEFRQPIIKGPDGVSTMLSLKMFYSTDDEGYAFTVEWDNTHRKSGVMGAGPNDFWPRFFWFGPCRHVWREIGAKEAREKGQYHAGMCYHVEECKLCGAFQSYDSSD